jgi:hypothetical protein
MLFRQGTVLAHVCRPRQHNYCLKCVVFGSVVAEDGFPWNEQLARSSAVGIDCYTLLPRDVENNNALRAGTTRAIDPFGT